MVEHRPVEARTQGSIPSRFARTHVRNVRWKEEKAIIILENKNKGDAGEMTWHEWINGGCEDLKNER